MEPLATEFRAGLYKCAKCNAVLYRSEDKFRAKGKWAAFRAPATQTAISVSENDFGGKDIDCASCQQNIGSLFHDGKESGDSHEQAKDRHLVLSSQVVFEASNPNEERVPVLPEDAAVEHTLKVEVKNEEVKKRPATSAKPTTTSKGSLKSSQKKATSNTSSASQKQSSPMTTSTAIIGAVAVVTVAIVGIAGYFGYKRLSNKRN